MFRAMCQHGFRGRSWGRSRCLGSAAAGSEPVLGDDVATDVLIVGGGPSGLVLSALLSRLGVRSILLEQRGEPTTHPQAHFVGVRTMEILRGLGVFDAEAVDGAGRRQDGLDAAVRAASPPREHWRTFRYCTAMLGGLDLGAAQHFSAAAGGASADELTSVDVQLDAASPAGVAHLAQTRLLPILMHEAQRHSSLAAIRMGERCRTLAYGDSATHGDSRTHAVQATSECAATGQEAARIRAHFVVGADGVHSFVRKAIEDSSLPTHPPSPVTQVVSALEPRIDHGRVRTPALQHLVSVHFRCAQLFELLEGPSGAGADAMLYFVYNEDAVGVVVAHDAHAGEFVAQLPVFPPHQQVDELCSDVAECERLLRALIVARNSGADSQHDFDLEILSARPWSMRASVASTFSSPCLRAHVIGDAAHQFPPAGGFGMNTSIADAHNLAWKLAASLRAGRGAIGAQDSAHDVCASAHLLTSYSTERRAAALRAAQLSLHLFDRSLVVPREIGLPPSAPRLLADALALPLKSAPSLPSAAEHGMKRVLSAMFDSATALARTTVISSLRQSSPKVRRVRQLVHSGHILPLVFLHHDLSLQEPYSSPFSARARADRPFAPSAVLGARLPHCWLEEAPPASRVFSSIDLPWWRPCGPSAPNPGCRFVLLTHVGAGAVADSPWVRAGLAVAVQGECDLITAAIQQPQSADALLSEWAGDGAHNLVVARAHAGCCSSVLAGEGSSAVLVRPDGHICWIFPPAQTAPSEAQCVELITGAWRQCMLGSKFDDDENTAAALA